MHTAIGGAASIIGSVCVSVCILGWSRAVAHCRVIYHSRHWELSVALLGTVSECRLHRHTHTYMHTHTAAVAMGYSGCGHAIPLNNASADLVSISSEATTQLWTCSHGLLLLLTTIEWTGAKQIFVASTLQLTGDDQLASGASEWVHAQCLATLDYFTGSSKQTTITQQSLTLPTLLKSRLRNNFSPPHESAQFLVQYYSVSTQVQMSPWQSLMDWRLLSYLDPVICVAAYSYLQIYYWSIRSPAIVGLILIRSVKSSFRGFVASEDSVS